MANLVIRPEEFAREIKVVMESVGALRRTVRDRFSSKVFSPRLSRPIPTSANDRLDAGPGEHGLADARACTSSGTRRTTPSSSWSATSSRERCSIGTALLRRARVESDPCAQNARRTPQRGLKRVMVKAPAELPYAPGLQGAGAAHMRRLGAVRDFASRGTARRKATRAPPPGPGAERRIAIPSARTTKWSRAAPG